MFLIEENSDLIAADREDLHSKELQLSVIVHNVKQQDTYVESSLLKASKSLFLFVTSTSKVLNSFFVFLYFLPERHLMLKKL